MATEIAADAKGGRPTRPAKKKTPGKLKSKPKRPADPPSNTATTPINKNKGKPRSKTPLSQSTAAAPARPSAEASASQTAKASKKDRGKGKGKSSGKGVSKSKGKRHPTPVDDAAPASTPTSFSIFSHGVASSAAVAAVVTPSTGRSGKRPAVRDGDAHDGGTAATATAAGPSEGSADARATRSDAAVATDLAQVLRGFADKAKTAVDSIETASSKLTEDDTFETGDGVSLLEAKVHLMLSYNATLGTLMARKLEGRSIEGHPLVDRLAYLRTVLEKIAPIEAKMKYQIDKYLRAATSAPAATSGVDPLTFRPSLDDLAPKTGGAVRAVGTAPDDDAGNGADGDDGVYVPPRIAEARFLDELNAAEKERRRKTREMERLASSTMMEELRSEFSSRPEEVRHGDGVDKELAKEMREHEEIEESNFVRFSSNRRKLEKKRARQVADLSRIADFDVTRGFSRLDEESAQLSMREQMAAAKKRRVGSAKKR